MSSAVSGRDSMLTGFLTGDLMAVDGQKTVQTDEERKTSQKESSEGIGLSFLFRKLSIPTSGVKENVASFNSQRQLFYDAIVRRFGGKAENIPQSVREVMKLDDFSLTRDGKVTSGKPLSDRRIGIVSAAISKHLREVAVLKELTGIDRSELMVKLGLKPSDSIPPRLKSVLFLVAGRADLAHEVGMLTKEMTNDMRGVYKAMCACERIVMDEPGKQGCGITIPVGGKSVEICLNRKDEMSEPKLMLRITDNKTGADPVELDFPALSLAETKDRIELDIVDNLKSFSKDEIIDILEQAHKQNPGHARAIGLRILGANGYSTSMFGNLSEQLVFTLAGAAMRGSLGKPEAVAKLCKDISTPTELGINDKETLEACERMTAEIKAGGKPQISKAEQTLADEQKILDEEAALREKELQELCERDKAKERGEDPDAKGPSAEELSKRINLHNLAAEIRERRELRKEADVLKRINEVQDEIGNKNENIKLLKSNQSSYSEEIKKLEGEIQELEGKIKKIEQEENPASEADESGAADESKEPASLFSFFGSFAKAVKSVVEKSKTPEQLKAELKQKQAELDDFVSTVKKIPDSIKTMEVELESLNSTLSDLTYEVKGFENIRQSQNVKNLMADLFYDGNTVEADSVLDFDQSVKERDPKEYEKQVQNARLAKVLTKHVDTIFQIITGQIDIDSLSIPEEYKDAVENIRKLALENITEEEREKLEAFSNPDQSGSKLEMLAAKGKMLAARGMMLAAMKKPEQLTKINEEIDKLAEKKLDELASEVKSSLDDVFGTGDAAGSKEAPKSADDDKPADGAVSKGAKVVADLKKKKTSLDEIVKESVTDTKSGQGAFLRKAIIGYFSKDGGLSKMDRRAMLAAGIRYAPRQTPFDETQQKGAMLGALFKGAGPILQKTLQGLDLKVLPLELQLAVVDIKDNLAPIPDEIVKAHLNDIIKRSKGHFTAIQVEKTLGAASVGQALLCTFTDAKGNKSEKVVKILRPDVKLRIERERRIFEKAAADIPGMSQTFQGQLERILDELDLTIEARNVEKGLVSYDDGTFSNLTSMKLDPNVPPTNNVMVLEKAPGTTLSRYIRDMKEQLQELKDRPCGTTIKELTAKRQALSELAAKLRKKLDMLANLSLKWVTDGLYGNGFFHGDLHSGNIMVDDDKLTVIDFGNATTLTKDQQAGVMKMMTGAAIGKESLFIEGYKQILSADGLKLLDQGDNAEQLKAMVSYVLKQAPAAKGGDKPSTSKEAGQRIFAILTLIQKMGLEAPGPIFNFSQGQVRLQNSMSDITKLIEDVADAMKDVAPVVDDDGKESDDMVFRSLCKSSPDNLTLNEESASVNPAKVPTFLAGLTEHERKDMSSLETEILDGKQVKYTCLLGAIDYDFGGCEAAKNLNSVFSGDCGFTYKDQKFDKEKCLKVDADLRDYMGPLATRLPKDQYQEIEDARKAYVTAVKSSFDHPGDVKRARTLRQKYNQLKYLVLAKYKKDIVCEKIAAALDYGWNDVRDEERKYTAVCSFVMQMGGDTAVPAFRKGSELYNKCKSYQDVHYGYHDEGGYAVFGVSPDVLKRQFLDTLRKSFAENDLYTETENFMKLREDSKKETTTFIDVMGSAISSNLMTSISNLGVWNTIVNIGSLSSLNK